MICTTLAISNGKDYSPAFIEENIKSRSPEPIAAKAKDTHFYVTCDGDMVIGCGGITVYWGSTEESTFPASLWDTLLKAGLSGKIRCKALWFCKTVEKTLDSPL
ncbi:hypothetical protein [Pseudoflavonifractor phocaeensis]|uniref:hypothetical protein n=1 Tax=Pseudoflavonifractor phocaeensis TaxID=1870988 RepID=UPI001F1CFABA|nr:hypothetical protein [Pseudoflavonifractor phocaeensis]MCF2596884.1 hypothetical protein [Pseudoflavonifractor phocaeensis]